jgi:two-component system LytT family response regulator
MKLKALIVDDELHARDNLYMLLQNYCPDVLVLGKMASAEEARQFLKKNEVDVVFLDIKMPGEDGFEFLNSLATRDFAVVFTTAYNEFALEAFKANAVDYLEKPIDIEDLINAVDKIKKLKTAHKPLHINENMIDLIKSVVNKQMDYEKTSIPTKDGLVIVSNKEIVYLEASESYTTIYLEDGKKYLSSKNIKVFEENLNKNIFFRTHKSYIINFAHHLKEFNRSLGNVAVLTTGAQIPVSRRKITDFLSRVNTF